MATKPSSLHSPSFPFFVFINLNTIGKRIKVLTSQKISYSRNNIVNNVIEAKVLYLVRVPDSGARSTRLGSESNGRH